MTIEEKKEAIELLHEYIDNKHYSHTTTYIEELYLFCIIGKKQRNFLMDLFINYPATKAKLASKILLLAYRCEYSHAFAMYLFTYFTRYHYPMNYGKDFEGSEIEVLKQITSLLKSKKNDKQFKED